MGEVGFSVSGRYLGKFLKERNSLINDLECTDEEAEVIALYRIRKEFKTELQIRKILQEEFDLAYPDKNKNKCPNDLYKLDIRPPPDLNFKDYFKFLKVLFLNYKLFELEKLVFEQRGDTNENLGFGFHCHSIVKLIQIKKGKTNTLKQIQTIIKKLKLDDTLALNCIELKPLKTQEYHSNILKYIDVKTFNKSDISKKPAWDKNEEWRKSLNLKDEYKSNNDFIEDPFTEPITTFI